jgi:hypothetical protein
MSVFSFIKYETCISVKLNLKIYSFLPAKGIFG